jgi:hypothetical protein
MEKVEVYYHDISIEIGGWKHDVRAGFIIPKNPDKRLPFGILGHNPIFREFKIIFDQPKEEIEFRPIP